MSHVEQVLHEDPAGAYALMDFNTRDHYRHVIEKIAKKCRLSEIEVADKAIELAKKGSELNGPEDRTAHVGFYLIDKGLPQLEHLTKIKYTITFKIQKGDFPVIPCFSTWVQSYY